MSHLKASKPININELLASYPRKHPDLPEAYQKIYVQHYKENREGRTKISAFARKFESWIHIKVAKSASGGRKDTRDWCRNTQPIGL